MRSSRPSPAWCPAHSSSGLTGRNSKSLGAGVSESGTCHQPALWLQRRCTPSLSEFQAGPPGWWARLGAVCASLPPRNCVSHGDPAHMPSLEAQAVRVRVHVRVYHEECCTASFSCPSRVRRGGSAACQDRTMVPAWLLPSVLLLSHSRQVLPPSSLSQSLRLTACHLFIHFVLREPDGQSWVGQNVPPSSPATTVPLNTQLTHGL